MYMFSVIHYRYPPSVYLSCPHLSLASTHSQFFGNGKRSCVNADPKKKHTKNSLSSQSYNAYNYKLNFSFFFFGIKIKNHASELKTNKLYNLNEETMRILFL